MFCTAELEETNDYFILYRVVFLCVVLCCILSYCLVSFVLCCIVFYWVLLCCVVLYCIVLMLHITYGGVGGGCLLRLLTSKIGGSVASCSTYFVQD